MNVFLDTHIVVWLYAGLTDKFNPKIKNILDESELSISPIVRLELTFLNEIKRIKVSSDKIVNELSKQVGLTEVSDPIDSITQSALEFSWTRDPFDRLLIGHAEMRGYQFVTKDRTIQENFKRSIW